MSPINPISLLLICVIGSLTSLPVLAYTAEEFDADMAQMAQQQQAESNAYRQGKTQFAPKTDVAPIGQCPDDLLGTFAAPANPPTAAIAAYTVNFFGPTYQAGQPGFKFTREKGKYFRTGLLSGNKEQVNIGKPDIDPVGQFYTCSARLDEDLRLVSVSYARLNKKQKQELAMYLERVLDMQPTLADLENVHYFLAKTGYDGTLLLPMQRLSKP